MSKKGLGSFESHCRRRLDFGRHYHELVKKRLEEDSYTITSDDFESDPGTPSRLFRDEKLSTWRFSLQVVSGNRIFRITLESDSTSEKSFSREIEFRIADRWINSREFERLFGVNSGGYYTGSSDPNPNNEASQGRDVSPARKAVGSDFTKLKFLAAPDISSASLELMFEDVYGAREKDG